DNSPAAEPQDVRAHLYGGVPKAEIDARAELFSSYGVDLLSLFAPRADDEEYVDFLPEGPDATAERIPGLAAAKEGELREAYEKWWTAQAEHFTHLTVDRQPMRLRERMVGGFRAAVEPVGVLDRYETAGIVADWWASARYDVKALAAGGYERVLDGWVEAVDTMVDPVVPGQEEKEDSGRPRRGRAKSAVSTADKRRALDEAVVRALIPEFLAEVARADAALAEADAAYKTAVARLAEARGPAEADGDEEDEAAEAEGGEATTSEPVDPAEIDALEKAVAQRRKERTAASKRRSALDAKFLPELKAAAEMAKAEDGGQRVVLEVLGEGLSTRLDAAAAAGRRELVASFRRWAEKYAVSLTELEADSDRAAEEFGAWLRELGYGR